MTKAEDEAKAAAEAKAAEEDKAKAAEERKAAKSDDGGKNLSSDPNKDVSKPIAIDHGKTPQYIKDQQKQAEEDAKNGDTPMQMRPEAHVNKEQEDAPAVAHDPLNPHLSDNAPKGGTLPPAG